MYVCWIKGVYLLIIVEAPPLQGALISKERLQGAMLSERPRLELS